MSEIFTPNGLKNTKVDVASLCGLFGWEIQSPECTELDDVLDSELATCPNTDEPETIPDKSLFSVSPERQVDYHFVEEGGITYLRAASCEVGQYDGRTGFIFSYAGESAQTSGGSNLGLYFFETYFIQDCNSFYFDPETVKPVKGCRENILTRQTGILEQALLSTAQVTITDSNVSREIDCTTQFKSVVIPPPPPPPAVPESDIQSSPRLSNPLPATPDDDRRNIWL